jgi:hypothetical protein
MRKLILMSHFLVLLSVVASKGVAEKANPTSDEHQARTIRVIFNMRLIRHRQMCEKMVDEKLELNKTVLSEQKKQSLKRLIEKYVEIKTEAFVVAGLETLRTKNYLRGLSSRESLEKELEKIDSDDPFYIRRPVYKEQLRVVGEQIDVIVEPKKSHKKSNLLFWLLPTGALGTLGAAFFSKKWWGSRRNLNDVPQGHPSRSSENKDGGNSAPFYGEESIGTGVVVPHAAPLMPGLNEIAPAARTGTSSFVCDPLIADLLLKVQSSSEDQSDSEEESLSLPRRRLKTGSLLKVNRNGDQGDSEEENGEDVVLDTTSSVRSDLMKEAASGEEGGPLSSSSDDSLIRENKKSGVVFDKVDAEEEVASDKGKDNQVVLNLTPPAVIQSSDDDEVNSEGKSSISSSDDFLRGDVLSYFEELEDESLGTDILWRLQENEEQGRDEVNSEIVLNLTPPTVIQSSDDEVNSEDEPSSSKGQDREVVLDPSQPVITDLDKGTLSSSSEGSLRVNEDTEGREEKDQNKNIGETSLLSPVINDKETSSSSNNAPNEVISLIEALGVRNLTKSIEAINRGEHTNTTDEDGNNIFHLIAQVSTPEDEYLVSTFFKELQPKQREVYFGAVNKKGDTALDVLIARLDKMKGMFSILKRIMYNPKEEQCLLNLGTHLFWNCNVGFGDSGSIEIKNRIFFGVLRSNKDVFADFFDKNSLLYKGQARILGLFGEGGLNEKFKRCDGDSRNILFNRLVSIAIRQGDAGSVEFLIKKYGKYDVDSYSSTIKLIEDRIRELRDAIAMVEGMDESHLKVKGENLNLMNDALKMMDKSHSAVGLNLSNNVADRELIEALAARDYKKAEDAIKAGASPNITDEDGNNILHVYIQQMDASEQDLIKLFNLLKSNKKKIYFDAQNNDGFTPLALMIQRGRGSEEGLWREAVEIFCFSGIVDVDILMDKDKSVIEDGILLENARVKLLEFLKTDSTDRGILRGLLYNVSYEMFMRCDVGLMEECICGAKKCKINIVFDFSIKEQLKNIIDDLSEITDGVVIKKSSVGQTDLDVKKRNWERAQGRLKRIENLENAYYQNRCGGLNNLFVLERE